MDEKNVLLIHGFKEYCALLFHKGALLNDPKRILIQYTEYIPSTKQAEYMLFPRVCALAEVVWTPKEKKDFTDFSKRMDTEYVRLFRYGVNYRKP